MKYYSNEKIAFYKKKAQLSLLFSIGLVSLAVVFFALSAFFISDKSILAIKIIDSIFLSFSSCFLFYSIVNVINPCKRKMNHIYTVMNSSHKHIKCKIIDIKEVKTISKSVIAKQLFVKVDDVELFINYNLDCSPRKFSIGSSIEVDVANSFIVNEDD